MNPNKKCVICLALIILISLAFKLYTVDFSLPVNSDNLSYTFHAISISHGNLAQNPQRGSGWPILSSIFIMFTNSDSLIDYSVIVRILSLGISTITIFPVYLLGRKFFNEKYSLVMASLFAFEPHLNFNSGFGLSEPLFHLILICAFYFILSTSTRYAFISFLLAGLAWWVRLNGFMFFIAFTLIYFINFRKSQNHLKNYGLCVMIFLLVISPMLIQRYEQFGNPVYVWYAEKIFAGSYMASLSENVQTTNNGPLSYIEENGITSFIQKFVIVGIYNILITTAKLTLPYLFILIPFGMFFSFRKCDQDKKFIRANWIVIVVTALVLIIPFSIVAEKRFIYYLFPFLIVFATITIQKVTDYGIGGFSFSQKQKNAFLIIVIGTVIVLSGLYVVKYGKPDLVLEDEKIKFATYVLENLNGKMLNDPSPAFEYFNYVKENKPDIIRNIGIINKQDSDTFLNSLSSNVTRIYINGTSLSEIVSRGEQYDLKYIVSVKSENVFYPFLEDVYNNEKNFPYLVKVFDSDNSGFTKLKVKVFEIDYQKFHSLD
jgi:4-amino-4-deoxy-L-arabinose transferase-like glycosyltransferase